MKTIYLICNAHLDPVWQWDLEEGIGAVLSTFRAAADFCETWDGFVFNHNEAMIYQWVERYENDLFLRIQRLVECGKWHIIGAWYLQPDCNLPSGESFVRQIEEGQRYFQEKFGKISNVGINFDPFGHTKGLVQILAQAGYRYYICCRPSMEELSEPGRDFIWEGFADSKLLVHRSPSYNSPMGQVQKKIENYIHGKDERNLVLWGVGNHGGGPSRKDLEDIEILRRNYPEIRIFHTVPEQYFFDIEKTQNKLPVWKKSLRPSMPGCYTSQVRVKQMHRRLEKELFFAERICSHAEALGLIKYPKEKLSLAQNDLLFSEFHDILPGSGTEKVEQMAMDMLGRGIFTAREAANDGFFALAKGYPKTLPDRYPVLVYNPHPYKVEDTIQCEFMLADQHFEDTYFQAVVYQGSEKIPSQTEKEDSNIPIQWRKKVAFHATLEPSSMNYFEIETKEIKRPEKNLESGESYIFENQRRTLWISRLTGLIEKYEVDGKEYLRKGTGILEVYQDDADPWGMRKVNFREHLLGSFRLANETEAGRISGTPTKRIQPVRIVEEGDVEVIVEADFVFEFSYATVRYHIDAADTAVRVEIYLTNNLSDCCIKWMLHSKKPMEQCWGRTAFGLEEMQLGQDETVSQEYILWKRGQKAISLIHEGTYGFHAAADEIGMTLLRGTAYCAHPIEGRDILPKDRMIRRIDQGQRYFQFTLNASEAQLRFQQVERESQIIQMPPKAVCFFPPEQGEKTQSFYEINNPDIVVSSLKPRKDGSGYLLRLYNSSREKQDFQIQMPIFGQTMDDCLQGYEIRTYHIGKGICEKSGLIDWSGMEGAPENLSAVYHGI